MARVFIALPVAGGFYPQMISSMFKLLIENPGGHTFVPFTMGNESLISRARSRLASFFLDTDCDYLLSIDADIEFPSDAVDRLIRHDKDIIAAPYPVKSTPTRWAVGFNADTPAFLEGVVPVRYVSTGFSLVKRHVIEALSTPDLKFYEANDSRSYHALYMPMLHETEDGTRLYLSEDYAFCQRAKDAGFEICCDFDIRLRHWGMNPYEMLEIDGKLPSHPMKPFAHELQDMVAMAASLTEQVPAASTPQEEYAQLMQNMMSSFSEVSDMLKDLAKVTAPPKDEPQA